MPEQPIGDALASVRPKSQLTARFRGRLRQKDPFPGDEDVVQPHLRIKLIEPAAQGRQEGVGVPCRNLPAHHGHARRRH